MKLADKFRHIANNLHQDADPDYLPAHERDAFAQMFWPCEFSREEMAVALNLYADIIEAEFLAPIKLTATDTRALLNSSIHVDTLWRAHRGESPGMGVFKLDVDSMTGLGTLEFHPSQWTAPADLPASPVMIFAYGPDGSGDQFFHPRVRLTDFDKELLRHANKLDGQCPSSMRGYYDAVCKLLWMSNHGGTIPPKSARFSVSLDYLTLLTT